MCFFIALADRLFAMLPVAQIRSLSQFAGEGLGMRGSHTPVGLFRSHQLFHQMPEPHLGRLLRMVNFGMPDAAGLLQGLTRSFIKAFNQINAGCWAWTGCGRRS